MSDRPTPPFWIPPEHPACGPVLLSSLDDFRKAYGELGTVDRFARIYDRTKRTIEVDDRLELGDPVGAGNYRLAFERALREHRFSPRMRREMQAAAAKLRAGHAPASDHYRGAAVDFGPAKGAVFAGGKRIGDVVDVKMTLVDEATKPLADLQRRFYEELIRREYGKTRSGTIKLDRISEAWEGELRRFVLSGDSLDAYAARVVGLTRAPGESDSNLRARIAALLKTYSQPTRKTRRKHMPATNPYDRRGPGRERIRSPQADEMMMSELSGHVGDPAHGSNRRLSDPATQRLEMADEVDYAGLTLKDVEELVRMKIRKARRDGDDAAYMRAIGDLQQARRDAWNEGRTAGHEGGRQEVLSRIDSLYGQTANGLRDTLRELLEGLDPTAAWDRDQKANIAALLGSSRDLLTAMIEGQHNGFQELPF